MLLQFCLLLKKFVVIVILIIANYVFFAFIFALPISEIIIAVEKHQLDTFFTLKSHKCAQIYADF
jgi:hypothetical protein